MRLNRKQANEARAPRTLARRTTSLYADDADGLDRDVLNRKRLATQLARAIRDLSEETNSAVVGLVGPWGSGKSSLLGQIETDLATNQWYVGHHNPWAYSDFAGAAAGFFSSLRDAVPEDVLGKEWRATVGEWVSKAAPVGAAGGVAGVDGSGAIGAVGAIITGDRSPARLRDDAARGLAKIDHPVLMVLDDLDRLSPEELLFTFKLVRLLGRLPNVYYLLAYDETTLTDLLETTELVGKGSGRAQQYLEKIIQVRLEIPPMLPEQQTSLANAAIDEICKRHEMVLSAGATQRLQQMWQSCLSIYLDQPRSVKRLFTQVDATWPDVAGEVDFTDYVAMTFLRVFERRILDLVITHRNEILQQPASISFASRSESPQDRWARWKTLLSAARPRHPDAVEKLLASLFIYLRGAREGTTYVGSSYQEDVSRRMGVGTSEHFDRYVQIGVPESDLAESSVRAAASELRSGVLGSALKTLTDRLLDDAGSVLVKLRREHETDPLPAANTLPFLASVYFSTMDQKSGIFGFSPDFRVVGLAVDVLDKEPPESASAILLSVADLDTSSVALAVDCVQSALQESEDPHPWAQLARDSVGGRLESTIRSLMSDPASPHRRLTRFLYSHRQLTEPSRTSALLWEIIDQGHWGLPEVLGLLVPLGQASDGQSTWTSLGDFSEEAVDTLLGIDAVLERLPAHPDLLARTEQDSYFERRIDESDLDARVEYALTGMERIRARRDAESSMHAATAGMEEPDGSIPDSSDQAESTS
ncbi:KAP family P-loop NTPase fold protein [Nocardioides guangzhouensis]|uniref:KAP family P-loop NTPase fold protein n=1 Tax=Nocardioides guangzhouensis TaxID=2497878 RepID=UPI0014386549|nr:P-loop NTPase fold protein [Nocardioides guangzhouensis]